MSPQAESCSIRRSLAAYKGMLKTGQMDREEFSKKAGPLYQRREIIAVELGQRDPDEVRKEMIKPVKQKEERKPRYQKKYPPVLLSDAERTNILLERQLRLLELNRSQGRISREQFEEGKEAIAQMHSKLNSD